MVHRIASEVPLGIGSLHGNRIKLGLRPSATQNVPCGIVVKKGYGCWTRITKFKIWLYTHPLRELR